MAETGKTDTGPKRDGNRYVYWTALIGLVAGCVGLSETGLKFLLDTSKDGETSQTIHVYHHAPYWEQLTSELLIKMQAAEQMATQSGKPLDLPDPSRLQQAVQPAEQEYRYPTWLPGLMLAIAGVSALVLLRRRVPNQRLQLTGNARDG